MSMNKDRRLEIKVGLFVIGALVLLAVGVLLLGKSKHVFEQRVQLHATFADVAGLVQGAPVRVSGVNVGTVSQIMFVRAEPRPQIRVDLQISQSALGLVRADSVARISGQGLLGDKIVEITLGSAAAAPLQPGETLASSEPLELQQMVKAGVETMQTVKELATGLKATAARVDRIAKEVETGKGLVHALVYDEPESLNRLNAILGRTQQLLARAEQRDSAVGVLLSPDSGKSARALLTAMDALGRGAEKADGRDSLLTALLYDPQYKAVADDLRAVAHNFRDVSERVAQGQGLLGQLTRDGTDGSVGALGDATADFRVAMANLRAVTDRLKAGEGTMGGLLEDPTVYENLVQFLEGARRSFLLRTLIRSTIDSGRAAEPAGAGGR
jgi:phospholipid/cholesterol/gamma-HCH transport system substrate-binding protein